MAVSDYITISVATLCSGSPIGVDLYSRDSATDKIRLYKQADYPLEPEDLERLQARGVRKLYIARGGQERYQEYLRLMLSGQSGAGVPVKARVGAMNEVVRDVLEESFAAGDVDQTVKNVAALSDLTVELMCDEQFVGGDLVQVLHHDYATFTHSANVAYYAVMLAKALGYSKPDLRQISTGALLHDLGKLEIRDSILCKPGRLDELEFRQIKRHPLDGFRKLCRREELSEGQLMMVYQHHEKLDGSGYPVGCVGDEIHPWAKLCCIVDIFEALTSVRPYRQPMKHALALELMERDAGRALDPEYFQCWKQIIGSCLKG